ncbi:MAG: hypothetical protein GF309_03200 [Candidatus Lokiarchaeota archaeon]|nr:hypothetical protein [Candidatus Lokiarchaeota archaeon]
MSPKKHEKKLPMTQRCGIFLILLVFAAIATFLGLNALGQAESLGMPAIFSYIPLGIAVIMVVTALDILTGLWTPKSRGRIVVRPM